MALDSHQVAETADRLCRRVSERFPGRGIGGVAFGLSRKAKGAEATSRDLARPMWALRAASSAVAILVLAMGGLGLYLAPVRRDLGDISDFVQGVQSLLQCLVYFAVAAWSVFGLEARAKRRRVLRELHSLRSLAHIIDMHQLDKDPSAVATESTLSSPERDLSPPELARYLNYSSEMLSIVAKLAAVYVQCVPDPVCVEAASDVEKLCLGLSQKVWQKIMLVLNGVP